MWERIKKILSKEGGKCIILKEGEPAYIVMRLDDYEGKKKNPDNDVEKANQDIAQWRSEENEKLPEETEEGVKIEDLPF